MSALTKTFVVLLVVMSLLSAAGFVVFVNRVENFKTAAAASQASISQKTADLAAAKAATAAVQGQLDAKAREVDAAMAENARLSNENADKVAALNATIARENAQSTIMTVTQDNLTAALNASEGQRKTQSDTLVALRTAQDATEKKLSDDEIALSDFTNKLDVAVRKNTDFSEQLAQNQSEGIRLNNLLKEHGIDPGEVPDRVSSSAVPINGVVRDTRNTNGIPIATISVGSAEQVTKGMVFNVVDRTHGNFLGLLTIDSVDLHTATGRLQGDKLADVRVGTEVKTQL